MENVSKSKNKLFFNFVYWLVKLRWLVAFFVFIILVSLKVNFSSIAEYNKYFPTLSSKKQQNEHIVFGKSRSIRSDEWAVHTPKYFAQAHNNFSKYSNKSGLSPANEIIDYYAPAKDITLLGKPFNWGYILFGAEYGISFYFCMLEILLLMSSFEMFLILTKRKILTSLIGMLFIALAPAIQWWLVPHISIVFVYAMSIFCLFYYFFTAKKTWQKACFGGLLVIAIIGFCLSFFPSVQLPLALFFIAMLTTVLARDKDFIVFNRLAAIVLFLVFLISFAVLLEFFLTSIKDLKLASNTEYPSKRFCLGGDGKIEDLFTNLTALFLPRVEMKPPFLCNSEIATFIHFSPIILFVYFKIRKRLKEEQDKDFYVGRTLFYCLLFVMFFLFVGFNETLAKITFFKFVRRTHIIYGFIAVIFCVWCFNILWTKSNILKKRQGFIYAGVYGFFLITMVNLELIKLIEFRFVLLEIVVFVLIFLFAMLGFKKMCGVLVFCVMVVSGGTVNPICVGVSPITNHPISKFVEQTSNKNPDDLWLVVEKDGYVRSNFLMANGARVIGGTQFYPDLNLWNKLNLDEKNYQAYNRYAHRSFVLTNEKESVFLANSDSIIIYINPKTLKKLNVKHILISEEYFKKTKWPEEFKISKEFEQDSYLVCSLQY